MYRHINRIAVGIVVAVILAFGWACRSQLLDGGLSAVQFKTGRVIATSSRIETWTTGYHKVAQVTVAEDEDFVVLDCTLQDGKTFRLVRETSDDYPPPEIAVGDEVHIVWAEVRDLNEIVKGTVDLKYEKLFAGRKSPYLLAISIDKIYHLPSGL